ncbi:hypothetical protein LFYK43_20380 [Ligilactobacillus salitolerans]|uniref:Uncharacterized protein n=1 Tax=Ligilactobacillus salitolerans TaxID=1808352 RepID=A0A401IVM7_9LACO|nr:hypothetical protein LFYK43_20380 [Ligilactobacillus salitolerans]
MPKITKTPNPIAIDHFVFRDIKRLRAFGAFGSLPLAALFVDIKNA